MGSGNTYCFGDSYTWSDMNMLVAHYFGKQPRAQVAERVYGNNLLPLGERANIYSWFAVGEVWFMINIEMFACYSQCMVNGV